MLSPVAEVELHYLVVEVLSTIVVEVPHEQVVEELDTMVVDIIGST
jgi:hydroxylamine reductase (hybrid-cluster protein)